jgi:GNAT superfamily N-acetyltransferase
MLDRIDSLELADLPECLALARDRDWPPEERKWRLLFTVGTVYGVRDDAGDLVGAAVLTAYGAGLAAISMVLVAARYGRRGIGRRLMARALADAGEATVFLNATDYGRPLYEKLGFVTVGATYTHIGEFASPGEGGSRPAEPGDLPAIRELDARVVGADRSHLIRRLSGFAEELRVIERDGRITGYAGAWRNVDNMVIGPVIADGTDDAETLIGDLAAPVEGPVRLDLDDRNPKLRGWATRHGVTPRSAEAVMVYGGGELPGDRDRWFVPVMQALG